MTTQQIYQNLTPDGETDLAILVKSKLYVGVPVVAQRVKNLTIFHEDVSSIPGLDQWVKDLALPWAVVQVAVVAQILCCCVCGVGLQLQPYFDPRPGTSIGGPKKQKKKKKSKLYVNEQC